MSTHRKYLRSWSADTRTSFDAWKKTFTVKPKKTTTQETAGLSLQDEDTEITRAPQHELPHLSH